MILGLRLNTCVLHPEKSESSGIRIIRVRKSTISSVTFALFDSSMILFRHCFFSNSLHLNMKYLRIISILCTAALIVYILSFHNTRILSRDHIIICIQIHDEQRIILQRILISFAFIRVCTWYSICVYYIILLCETAMHLRAYMHICVCVLCMCVYFQLQNRMHIQVTL